MSHLLRAIRQNINSANKYFREAEAEIAKKNMQLLKALALVVIGLLLFFFVVTPLLIRGWTVSMLHVSFLPAAVALLALSMWYDRRGRLSPKVVVGLCVLFEIVLFVFVILIDAVAQPTVPATFMPLICLALPTLFILPRCLSYLTMGGFGVIYIIVVYALKPPLLAQYDVFAAVVGMVFSLPVSQSVMRLRVRDHETRMQYQMLSMQDALVGILNKKTCIEAAKAYMAASAPKVMCMLLVMDIDHFKDVNDNRGHYTGDRLLHGMAEILQETFRATDIIGRFGGDEFIVLVKGVADKAVLSEKCLLIQRRLRAVSEKMCSMPVTCSIGGAMASGQNVDFDTLFQQADKALYLAKDSGKNMFVLSDSFSGAAACAAPEF